MKPAEGSRTDLGPRVAGRLGRRRGQVHAHSHTYCLEEESKGSRFLGRKGGDVGPHVTGPHREGPDTCISAEPNSMPQPWENQTKAPTLRQRRSRALVSLSAVSRSGSSSHPEDSIYLTPTPSVGPHPALGAVFSYKSCGHLRPSFPPQLQNPPSSCPKSCQFSCSHLHTPPATLSEHHPCPVLLVDPVGLPTALHPPPGCWDSCFKSCRVAGASLTASSLPVQRSGH